MKTLKTILLIMLFFLSCKQEEGKTETQDVLVKKDTLVKVLNAKNELKTISAKDSNSCGSKDYSFTQQQAIKERTALLARLKQLFSTTTKNKTKLNITNFNNLEVIEEITFNNKTEYNMYKLSLEKLANVSLNENKLTIYTKRKDIEVKRFGYKSLKGGQFTVASNLSKEKNQELYSQLKLLSSINCFLQTLE